MQEREEAEKLYPTDEAAAREAAKTFEPDEDLQAAQAQAGVAAAPAADTEMAEASQKGPTPEQMIAVKAAIANATTLDEIQRLEAALTTGQLPSEFDVEADGSKPEGMEVG